MASSMIGIFSSRLRAIQTHPQGLVPLEFSQREDKAGLLVTEELEKAIRNCKNKVEAIARECRQRNRRYRDIEFDLQRDLDRCLHGLNIDDDLSPSGVLRVPQLFSEPKFFVDGPSSSDLVQGQLGDCWLISAFATISMKPGLIEQICVARDEQVGIYGFIFFRDAGWVEVIIDDTLCTSVPKYDDLDGVTKTLYKRDKDLYNRIARKGSKSLYFGKSGTENETWVPLIEKAYAKLHGDYAALSGGWAADAIEDLTGGVSNEMLVSDILDPDEFWNNELLRANEDRLFGCAIDNGNADPDGLISGHAYSIIRAVEVNGKRFLKIRNPWGDTEWTGRWSDGSKEWTGEWLSALPALGHKFGNDGEFIMEYEDFLSTWTTIDRTRLFDSSWMLSSQWLNVSSRSFPCAWSFGDASFTITVPQSTPAVIVLSRLETRHFDDISGCYVWSCDFVIYKKGDDEPVTTSTHDRFAARSVNVEVQLEAGEYVVHVRLDRWEVRSKTYFEDKKADWNTRKLSRKLTEKYTSMSIASNFDPTPYADSLPLKKGSFNGQSLTEIEAALSPAAEDPPKAVIVEAVSVVTTTSAQETTNTGSATGSDVPKDPTTVDGLSNITTSLADSKPSENTGADVPNTNPETSKTESAGPPPVVHNGYTCSSCKTSPIVGPRFQCLDSNCKDYSLCQKCVDAGKHAADHNMIRINTPDEGDKLKDPSAENPENDITIGLRVYTQRYSPATVKGQLRHGKILQWTKNPS